MFCVFVFVTALQGRDLRKRWVGTADSDTTVAEMEELQHQEVWRKGWRSWRRYVF